MSRQRYTEEFKIAAVKQLTEQMATRGSRFGKAGRFTSRVAEELERLLSLPCG